MLIHIILPQKIALRKGYFLDLGTLTRFSLKIATSYVVGSEDKIVLSSLALLVLDGRKAQVVYSALAATRCGMATLVKLPPAFLIASIAVLLAN